MKYILPITIIILFIVTIILLIIKIRQKKQSVLDNYIKYNKEKLAAIMAGEEAVYNKLVEDRQKMEEANARRASELQALIQTRQALTKETIESIDAKKEAYINSLKDYEEVTRKALDDRIWQHFQNEKNAYDIDLQKIVEEMRGTALAEYEALVSTMQEQLGALQYEIEDYQEKRSAINAEILRQRAIEEKQDFYRIVLDQAAIDDINVLNSIRKSLHKHDSFDKLIYDTYISKPVQEMVKRVLEGRAPSGIYKITRLRTGEIYIGKSTDIKARWTQHVKTVFGCGTIAHSVLHTTMARDGIDQFTFELLEEVPKDKLSEREKYWISFYDSKRYGLNEKEGG